MGVGGGGIKTKANSVQFQLELPVKLSLAIKRAEEADFGIELAFNLRRYIERKNWKYFEVIFQIPISRYSS